MHQRTIIRNEIVTILNAQTNNIGIYNTKIFDTPAKLMPLISVYTIKEITKKTEDEGAYRRFMECVILCREKGPSDLEGTLISDSITVKIDNLTEIVENIFLTKYQTINKTCYRMNLMETKVSFIDADYVYADAEMKFIIEYHTELAQ